MALLLISLLLKIVMTASIVVGASVVVERSGPFVGSLIAALPTAGGAAMIILAIEHPPAFIAQSAVGSMLANAVLGLVGFAFACTVLHFSADAFGSVIGLTLALLTSVGWSLAVLLARRHGIAV